MATVRPARKLQLGALSRGPMRAHARTQISSPFWRRGGQPWIRKPAWRFDADRAVLDKSISATALGLAK